MKVCAAIGCVNKVSSSVCVQDSLLFFFGQEFLTCRAWALGTKKVKGKVTALSRATYAASISFFKCPEAKHGFSDS